MSTHTMLEPRLPTSNGYAPGASEHVEWLAIRASLSAQDLADVRAAIRAEFEAIAARLHDEYLTVAETAALLKVDRTTLIALERRGELVPARVGTAERRQIIRYARSTIAAFIQRHSAPAA